MALLHRLTVAALAVSACCMATAVESKSVDVRTSLATKTAYWDQGAQHSSTYAQKLDADYQLLQIQQVSRHGERFPTKGSMNDIIAFISKLQTNYSAAVPAWIKTYKLPYNLTVEGELALAGVTDLRALGERTCLTTKSDAIPAAFSAGKFVMQHTYKSRTKNSAKAFASAFFENPEQVEYIEYPQDSIRSTLLAVPGDLLLRFSDQCPKYVRDVDEGKNATIQVDLYKETKQMAKNIDSLRSAFQLPKSAALTADDVDAAFSACGFELALYGIKDQWCSLLSKDLVKSIEFQEDLESFYGQGAGFKINYEIASVLLKDILQFMTDFVTGKTQVVGNFRFAHAETTLPLMTLLGYGSRTPLLASFSKDAVGKRGFRTSELAPFGANIDFRLYEKKSDSSSSAKKTTAQSASKAQQHYYVQVLVNEKVAKIPGCDDVLCKLAKVQELWSYYLTEYDFDAECKV